MEHNHPERLPDIRKAVVLNAPIEQVWEKAATSDGIAAWFMPNTFEPKVGHEFILHAGRSAILLARSRSLKRHIVWDSIGTRIGILHLS